MCVSDFPIAGTRYLVPTVCRTRGLIWRTWPVGSTAEASWWRVHPFPTRPLLPYPILTLLLIPKTTAKVATKIAAMELDLKSLNNTFGKE